MANEESSDSRPLFQWLDRVDRGVYAVEKGIVTFSLLILAATYFFEIIYGELKRADHALDRVLCRFMGYERVSQAPEAIHQLIHDRISPIIGIGLALFFSYLAVVIRDREKRLGWGKRCLWTGIFVALGYGFLEMLINVPSRYVVMGTLVAGLVSFGFMAFQETFRKGCIFVALWGPVGYFMLTFAYGLDEGYAWSTELGKVLIMWVGFFGASMATRDKRHIRIDFVRKALSEKRRSQYNVWSYFVTLFFLLALTVMAIYYLKVRISLDCQDGFPGGCQELDTIPIATWLVVAPVPAAFILMMIRFSGRLVLAALGEERELGGEISIPGPSLDEEETA